MPTNMPSPSNVLPDCRSREARGAVLVNGVYWQPVYCANCGADGGLTPEDSTFFFWLCNSCFATMGEITNVYLMPDEVYWERVKEEQLEKYGRLLTSDELATVVAADATPLATLIKQGR
jgi:hypothetical protein